MPFRVRARRSGPHPTIGGGSSPWSCGPICSSGTDEVLLVDDWIETGSQALAARALIEGSGAIVRRAGRDRSRRNILRRSGTLATAPSPRRRRSLRPRRCATFGAMTEQLFAEDAYLTSCEATVVDIRDEGVILDKTVFYARGGGQPGDTGTLRWEGGLARVTDTVKMGGDIVHQVEGDAPLVGHSVTAEIDWGRRHRLMRTHTALHVALRRDLPRVRSEGDGREHGRHGFRPDGLRARRDEPGARQGGRGEAQRGAQQEPPGARDLPPSSRGARGSRPDPDEGEPDPRVRGSHPRDRHRGDRQAGGRRDAREVHRRGRTRHRRQDGVEGQGLQADADPARGVVSCRTRLPVRGRRGRRSPLRQSA